jgi:hypothetical protein
VAVHDFSQIGVVLGKRANKFRKVAADAVKIIGAAGIEKMIDSTPVDKAIAVSNWQVTHGSPAQGFLTAVVPSIKGSGAGAAKARVKAEARARVKAFRLGRTMYYTNNTPYIVVLDRGDAKHTPANMFAKGVQSMRVRAKTIRIIRETVK